MDNKEIFETEVLEVEEVGEVEEKSMAEKAEAYVQTMEQMGMDERIIRAVQEMGFEKMTPIQEQAIPELIAGKDLLGQAQTGTGKTAAFGIPLIQNVDPANKALQGIVLCPTRELAIQASEELRKIAKFMHGIKVLPVYGGQDIGRQIKGLRGVQIVVGTPGRVMDHMRRHTMKMDDIRMVVLDEADEMLNMGFREDMETILADIPQKHQTALFSATMPQPILEITNKFQDEDAVHIKVAAKELTIPLVKQVCYRVSGNWKMEACARILEYNQPKLALIFCNTKKMVDDLTENLKKRGYQAEGLHGDLSQNQRDTVMNRFRGGAASILIATDVAARGIDVDDVEVVINYDIPQDIEYYVHRIGRTGRAGRTGKAFTLLSGREGWRIREIEKICRTKIAEQRLPGAKEVTKARADKILQEIVEIADAKEISSMEELIEAKMEETGKDAIELAAAFLRQYIGDEIQEIPMEERPRPRRYSDGMRGDNDRRGRGGRYGRDGGNRGRDREGFGRGDRGGRRENRYGADRENRFGRERSGNERSGRRRDFAGDAKGGRYSDRNNSFKSRSGRNTKNNRKNG